MGTPLPPNEPGNDCVACFGVGKQFGDVTTPRVVRAWLTDLDWGDQFETGNDQAILIRHLLEQTAAPCIFHINDGAFTWILQWFAGFTEFSIVRNSDGKSVFFHDNDQGCALTLDNEILTSVNSIAFNGFAHFDWPLGGLS